MKKLVLVFLMLLSSLVLINAEEVLLAEITATIKGGVKKYTLSKEQKDTYKKLIINYVKNEVRFGVIRIFFDNESELNNKGGDGTLLVNKENKKIEIKIDNPNPLDKITFYFSNARDEDKECQFNVYGSK